MDVNSIDPCLLLFTRCDCRPHTSTHFNFTSGWQIDRLNLEGYANLEHWVARLDERIEGTLLQRLTSIIQLWCAEFERSDDDDSHTVSRLNNVSSREVGSLARRGGRGDKKLERMLLKGESDKVCFRS